MSDRITIRNLNILLFSVFLLINYFQPLIVDDLCYGSISALSNHTILKHIITDYYYWTGRIVADSLEYIVFNKDYEVYFKIIFNVINAFFLISFINIIFYIAIKNEEFKKTTKNFLAFIFVFLGLLVFSGFFKNLMWKTVGLQYFWGIWLLSYLYFKQFYKPDKLNNKFILLMLGLFIGLYHEIYFAVILILGSGYLLNYIGGSQKRNIKNIAIFLIGNFIGGIILLVAPGNYVRQKILNAGKSLTLSNKLHSLMNAYLQHKLFLVIFMLTILFISIDKQKSRIIKVIMVGSIIFMLFITLPVANYGLAPRMLMLPYVVLWIILFQYLFSLDVLCARIRKTSSIFLLTPTMVFLGILIFIYYNLFIFSTKRHAEITTYIHNGVSIAKFDVYEPRFKFFSKFIYFDDIEINSSNWKNNCFSEYYNFKKVQLVPKK